MEAFHYYPRFVCKSMAFCIKLYIDMFLDSSYNIEGNTKDKPKNLQVADGEESIANAADELCCSALKFSKQNPRAFDSERAF